MQLLSKYNKGIKYLLCAIDLFSKCAWVVPLKGKRRITIVKAFQKIISKGRKTNKIWVDPGGEFYNKLFKRFFEINNIEMYSKCNEGKSVVAEIFIRTLKNKMFKDMTAVSKNVYVDVFENFVNKYNNTVNRTIKMKLMLHLILLLITMKIWMKKILNFNFVSEYKTTKTFLLRNIPKIGLKKFLSLAKL